jgi:CRP/FNR family transcriptional regulator
MSDNLAELLAHLPVFAKLTERERADVAKMAIMKTYAEGELIALQGHTWKYCFILITGEISVQKLSPEGRSLGAWRLSPKQVFWSPSLFDDGPLPASLEARKACQIQLWPHERILPSVQNNQPALWDLCFLLTQRMRQASEIVEDLAFHPVTSRLARLLVKQYAETAHAPIERSFTLDEMATMIGTTPVMVCKILSRFAGEEIIKVSRTEFEIVEHDKLEQIARL